MRGPTCASGRTGCGDDALSPPVSKLPPPPCGGGRGGGARSARQGDSHELRKIIAAERSPPTLSLPRKGGGDIAIGTTDMTATNLSTTCCVVGGGPAGLMLGFLLARAG